MPENKSRLVYSTERSVPRKMKAADAIVPTSAGSARSRTIVRLDRKGRGGKAVTVVEGLRLPVSESEKLLKQLKGKLGAGGTVKNDALEIQGDHCDALMAELTSIGYRPKRSGG